MIAINDIYKTFSSDLLKNSTQVLKGASFQILPGEISGFLGANGAGKTTCIKIMMGFIRADRGSIIYEGIGKGKIGFVPERPYYYKHLTGGEFLQFMAHLNKVKQTDFVKARDYWLERLSIAHAVNKKLKDYSKGMLQRVGLASALIHSPELLILDEPFSGLDPVGRRDFKEIFLEIKKTGKGIFLSSHILPEMEEMCDRIVYLSSGQIRYNGRIEELLSNGKDQMLVLAWGKIDEFKKKLVIEKEIDQNRATFIVNSNELQPAVNYLIDNGAQIKSILPFRKSLEEIFYENEKGLTP